MSHELAVIAPQELVRQSTDIAGLCKEIVVKSAMEIQGRKYVKVEGWQSIATAHGCVASSRDVERIDGGFRSIGEVKRMSDGSVIAQAEGFVGEDEPTWFGGEIETRNGKKILPKRPDYAIRAMAQTRAISRACRSAFAHVVVLMDAGLSTTPAEEVPHGGFDDGNGAVEHRQQAREQRDAGNRNASVVATHVHFGKHKGKPITDLEPRTLAWFVRNEEEARAAGKKRYDADTALYEGVKAEIERRKGTSSTPADDADDRIPMHNGPKHEELASRLHFESITTEDFIEAMRAAKQLPEHAKHFEKMTEETAAKFVADLDGTVEVVKNWQATRANGHGD